jgi:hypothetical protein
MGCGRELPELPAVLKVAVCVGWLAIVSMAIAEFCKVIFGGGT